MIEVEGSQHQPRRIKAMAMAMQGLQPLR